MSHELGGWVEVGVWRDVLTNTSEVCIAVKSEYFFFLEEQGVVLLSVREGSLMLRVELEWPFRSLLLARGFEL